MRDRLAPEVIEAMEFTTTLRGYDKDEVESFLREIAEDIRDLQRDAEQKPYLSLGDEIGALLQHARDSAEKITADAQQQAEGALAEAQREAAAVLADARASADQIEEAARDHAHEMEREAERSSNARVAEAEVSVERLKEVEVTVRGRVRDMRAELDIITTQLAAIEVGGDEAADFEAGPVSEADIATEEPETGIHQDDVTLVSGETSESEAGDDEGPDESDDAQTIWLEPDQHNVR